MKFYYLHILTGMAVALAMSGCQHSAKSVQQSEYSFESDTVPDVAIADDSSHRFEDSASMMDYLEDDPKLLYIPVVLFLLLPNMCLNMPISCSQVNTVSSLLWIKQVCG